MNEGLESESEHNGCVVMADVLKAREVLTLYDKEREDGRRNRGGVLEVGVEDRELRLAPAII